MTVEMEELEWMHFTFTKTSVDGGDDQKVRMYKNGELETYGYPITTQFDKLKIGMNRNGGGGWYGYIDDFRLYDRSLSVAEVEELYESYN